MEENHDESWRICIVHILKKSSSSVDVLWKVPTGIAEALDRDELVEVLAGAPITFEHPSKEAHHIDAHRHTRHIFI